MPILTTGAGKYPAAAGGGYVGPGDIVTGTPLAFWSLRAFSALKAAAAVPCIDIQDAGAANQATLAVQTNGDLNTTVIASGSGAGGSLATWIGAHGAAFVMKIYDQVGSFHMLPVSGIGQTLVLNLYGTKPGIQYSGGHYTTAGTMTQAQPFSITSVAKRTSGTSGNDGILGSESPFALLIGFYSVATQLEMYNGSPAGIAVATEGVGHAIQWIFNNPTGWVCNVDGTTYTPTPGTSNISASKLGLGDRAGGAMAGGDIEEVGMWAGATSSAQYLALAANQKAYWGTP